MSESYIHREHKGEPGAPTFLVLHGTGGDENQFFELARALLPKARVIAPRGDVSEFGALRYFRRTGEGVYDMADLARATAKLGDFIAGLSPDGPVIGLGYSNGANILASVLLERPEIIESAVLMHPLIPWTPEPVAGLAGRRILITAGQRDPICPAPQTQALIDYFGAQKAQVEAVWHEGGHELRQGEIEAVRRFVAPYA